MLMLVPQTSLKKWIREAGLIHGEACALMVVDHIYPETETFLYLGIMLFHNSQM